MSTFFIIFVLLAGTNAHLSAFNKGMYCINGTQKGVVNQNADVMVSPMFDLELEDWWFQHYNGCDEVPPVPGDLLELPAGGTFTVEIAANQAFTSLSFGGKYRSPWPDGKAHPNFFNLVNSQCITNPNIHTQNLSMAAGTAFAISYQSELSQVTIKNLVIFSVNYTSPWYANTTYDVPAKMPPCPAGGCICAWGWVPNGCGEPNMYMQGYKCNVTGSTSTTPLASPNAPVWCEGTPSNCTQGAKQFIGWNQKSGNNIEVEGFDLAGGHKSPGYNSKCGFSNGAQNDIFAEPNSKRRLAYDDQDTIPVVKRHISSHRRYSRSLRLAARNPSFH